MKALGTRLNPYRMRYVLLHPGAQVPIRGHHGDAGWDLFTCEDVTIPAWSRGSLSSGVAIQFPEGVWGRITSRSSTLQNHNLLVIEGIIDNGYRGELYVQAFNLSPAAYTVEAGTRVAQLIPHHVLECGFEKVQELDPSPRGSAGFGSTGKKERT